MALHAAVKTARSSFTHSLQDDEGRETHGKRNAMKHEKNTTSHVLNTSIAADASQIHSLVAAAVQHHHHVHVVGGLHSGCFPAQRVCVLCVMPRADAVSPR